MLVALDVSPDVAAEAAETGADLIVSHHPVMNIRCTPSRCRRSGRIPGWAAADGVGERDISAVCMHTNLWRRRAVSTTVWPARWVCRIQNR